MPSASDEKWRPFNCFFQSGRAKDLSVPLYKTYNVTLRFVRVTVVIVEKQCLICTEGAFVALVIQHEKRMGHVAICGLSGCTVFFNIAS